MSWAPASCKAINNLATRNGAGGLPVRSSEGSSCRAWARLRRPARVRTRLQTMLRMRSASRCLSTLPTSRTITPTGSTRTSSSRAGAVTGQLR